MPGKTVIRRGLNEDQRDRAVNILEELKLFEAELMPRDSVDAIRARNGIRQVMIGFGLLKKIDPDSSEEG
jgi:hypothetical protein